MLKKYWWYIEKRALLHWRMATRGESPGIPWMQIRKGMSWIYSKQSTKAVTTSISVCFWWFAPGKTTP
jgi:hypothetical protein